MNIYRENIMDNYKNPKNKGKLHNPDFEAQDTNISCDDKMVIQVKMKDDKIKDIKFDGNGCAISIAAASILTGNVKGKTIGEVEKMNYKDIYELLGVELDAVRTRCATLCLSTLKKALRGKNGINN